MCASAVCCAPLRPYTPLRRAIRNAGPSTLSLPGKDYQIEGKTQLTHWEHFGPCLAGMEGCLQDPPPKKYNFLGCAPAGNFALDGPIVNI
jgi:hypothetical protein